jgi:superfamily I DNA and/or RNA helicase
MANPIGKLISTCFYGGAIVSKGPQLLEGLNFIKFDDKTNKDFYKPIKWVDTSNVENHETPDRGSRYNNSEANEIVSSILSLSKMKSVGISKLPENLTILVIAPYAAQVNRIKKSLEKEAVANLNIDVLSVDAVQGREADLVFFSPVRSNADPGNIGFITRERINVALSRAKQSLVIVGNASFWDEGNSKLSDVYKYIQTLSESEAEIQVLP